MWYQRPCRLFGPHPAATARSYLVLHKIRILSALNTYEVYHDVRIGELFGVWMMVTTGFTFRVGKLSERWVVTTSS